MRIKFIKEIEDIRPDRNKTMKVGQVIGCSLYLGEKYINLGVAIDLDGKVVKPEEEKKESKKENKK